MSDPIFEQLLAVEQNKTQAPAGNTVFDSLMGIEQRKSQQFLGQIDQAIGVNPDLYSAEKKTAKALGQPVAAVQALPEDAEREAKLKAIRDDTAQAPILRDRYTDADFAKLAHDDSSVLSQIEGAVQTITRYFMGAGPGQGIIGTIKAAPYRAAEAFTGVKRAAVDIVEPWVRVVAGPDNQLKSLSDWYGQQSQAFRARANEITQPEPGIIAGGLEAGAGSFIQSGKYLPLAIFGGPPGQLAALGGMAMETFGQSYNKAADKNVGLNTRLAYALSDAVVEFATERGPLAGLTESIKVGTPVFTTLLKNAWQENKGEQVATALQDLNEWAVLDSNQGKSFRDYLAERPAAAAQTAIAVLMGASGNVALAESLDRALTSQAEFDRRMKDAEASRAMLEQLSALTAQAKLKARDPEVFERYMGALTDGTPVEDLYIGANVLMQSGVGEQLAQALPSVAEQLPAALASDGYVRIPTAQYASVIAGSQFEQSLIDHVKVDPNGYTFAESKEYAATFNQEMQTQLERAFVAQEGDAAFKAERDQVRDDFLAQLNAAKPDFKHANDAYASMLANFYAVTAAKLGITPRELVDRYALNVAGREQRAAQFNQITPEQALATNVRLELPSDALFAEAVANTPGAQITENGLLIDLVRYQRPEQEGAQAIRTGVFYLPNGAATAKHYKTGKTGYGGTEKFTGKTLIRRPLFVKGATGGKAPQAAYDELKGKKAYDKMREDVLKVALGWGKTQQQKVDGVREVLAKYGADPSLADEIVRVSREGNTLPYAVQENIVAHAVREAGYDAVIGYSKGKAGANISEVFDVREQTFPARGMDSDVHADFEQAVYNQRRTPRDDYTLDLFDVPTDTGADTSAAGSAAGRSARDLSRDDAPGRFATRTEIVEENTRTLGTDRVTTPAEAAQALAYLGKGAVERFDALITDAEGRPLAIVGAFKGALSQASVYPATLASEAFRINGAANIWFAHNHPSGTPELSAADRNLNRTLSDVFRGSEIQAHGLFAIAGRQAEGRKWTFAPSDGTNDATGSTTKPSAEVDVPVVERVFVQDEKLGFNITSPADAKTAARNLSGGESGVILLDAQHAPIAFVPVDPKAAGELRTGGRMDALWRAISVANAGAAIIVNNDAYTDEQVRNLAGFFKSADVRALDVMDTSGDKVASYAEQGRNFAADTFRQGARGQIAFGQDITETPSVIALLKNADLSTFLHESGHFFLQVQADLAARIQAQIDGGASVTEGERSIVEDMAKLLDWMGVKAEPDASALEVWLRMTPDEQREYHEKFARGFEAYAFEGKAPTMELQGIFQRFASWLLHVYQALKNLNVELTDEVRGVMDRMLATREQIEAAEAARNMGPLFNPQNAEGLIEDWQAYHALANDATLAAVDDLQAKSLKELQWASRARARALKDLQRQHNAIRAELKMEARREVMSQPVYRAWQFLTGKLSKEDRAALKPEAERKSLPGTLDPSIDSLFVAIAKLGGLDRAQVESQWGWDKKERTPSPVFGKPLLRRENGMSIDAMGELLADYGYLPKDEHGKYDMADFEEAFDAEYRGTPVYSIERDYANAMGEARPGEGLSLENIGAGRFDLTALKALGLDESVIDRLQGYGMTAKDGIHPDIVADLIVDENGAPVFTSGNELAQRLAEATPPKVAIEKLTDQMMLERFGNLATPEAIQRAADEAVHNELRAKMLHAEARALERAMDVKAGKRQSLLPAAAREFAQRLIAGLKVRDIRPAQYAAAEVRAAKAAEREFAANNLEAAAEQKRIQIVNHYATREAYAAQEEIRSAVAYLRKFEKRSKSLDPDYYDQIVAILERFDLVPSTSLKAIDKRTSLANWLKSQEEAGIVPEIAPEIAAEAYRKSYKDMTVAELRGLRDTIKQIDHLGRLKSKLLTAQDQREFDAIRDDITESIIANGKGRIAENRTPNTVLGEKLAKLKKFWASHIKAATWARIMDGGQDGGPVWEYLIRTANAAGDKEVGMREEATRELSALLAPVLAEGKLGGKGEFFPSIGRSLNKEARLAIALNIGNESNAQRLLGGEGWTVEQVKPVLDTLTTADWNFVQAVWDYFESYRPEIAAKERRVYGAEPQWIEARPLTVQTCDGDTLNLRGGYYPVKYDPRASERAESHMEAEDAKRMMQGAYTSATTRRSFTKQRAEAVVGRPLLLSLDGIYNGVNEVIHDLSWHEWLIDANRIIKNPKIAEAMRETYGAEVHQQFKGWIKDVAEGERGAQRAGEDALAWIRQGTSVAGLGLNVMSALTQPFGITQSMVRVGGKWIGRGIAKAIADPVGINAEINGMSEFMRTRSLTRMRELAELRNQVKGQTKTRANIDAAAYALMLRAQQLVDVPTWWGAYEKAIAEGNGDDRAVALADQAVIDAQGSGTTKDLAAIERGGPALKLFTTFYSFMNTSLNLGVAQVMTRESKAKLAADMLMIYVVPVLLVELMKSALTPGDSGEWDDPKKAAMKVIKAELSYLFGLIFGLREFSGLWDAVQGKPGGDYSGPAGTRFIADTMKLAKQVGQGEMDDGLRKAVVNVAGELFRLPAAQVNRTITGAEALAHGDTRNPAAVVFGYEKPH